VPAMSSSLNLTLGMTCCFLKGTLMADLFHLVGFEPLNDAALKRSEKKAAQNKARGVSDGAHKAALSRRQDAWRRSGQPEAIALGELTREDWEVCLKYREKNRNVE